MGFNHRLSNTGNLLTNTQFIEIPTTGSLRFNGSTGYLTIPSNAAVTLGTNAYTIEMWVYPNNNSQNAGLFQLSSSATYVQTFPANQLSIQLYNGYIQFGSDTAWNVGLGVAANAYVANQWYHVAMTRQSGGLTRFFINGVQVHSLTETTNYTGSYLVVGGFYQLPTYVLNGNLSNFRLVKGTAVYTSNFTPPTTALTAIANTVLLLNTTPSQPFVDSSSSNLAITVIGGVTANTLTPFVGGSSTLGVAAVRFTANNIQGQLNEVLQSTLLQSTPFQGSLRFDGSTGYLSVPYSSNFEFGNGNFTVEFWMYISSTINGQGLMSFPHNAGNYGQVLFFGNGSFLTFYSSSDGINWDVANSSSLGSLNFNEWNHIAVSKSGSSIRTFKNGVLQATITFAGTFAGTYDRCWIGDTTGNNFYNGLFSNIRVVKGTALYTANFTPPTTALTAISGTQLLLNTTTTQPFVDSSSSNLAITVIGGVTSNTISPTLTIPNPLITSPKLRLSNTGIMYVAGQFDEYNLRVPLISYLVVAGGGGGADRHGGGGGGGGYLANTASLVPGVNYTITVGGGGVAGNYESGGLSPAGVGGKGSNSSISSIATSFGGGGGGTYDGNPTGTFGSGGGGGGNSFSGIAGIVGQGNSGGSGLNPGAGGGGGAGAVGGNANAGSGGAGKQWLNGNYYAGGGGGAWGSVTGPATPGGIGGGGAGAWNAATIEPGFTNTGGGGGGSRSEDTATVGRPGGSGIVIIRYDDIYPDAANTTGSPSFTNSGGFKTYTFTGSGTIRF